MISSIHQALVILSIIVTRSISILDQATEEENADIISRICQYLQIKIMIEARNPSKDYQLIYDEIKEYQRIPSQETYERYLQLNVVLDAYDEDDHSYLQTGFHPVTEDAETISKFEDIKKNLFVEVPHVINFIWIGALSITQLEYLKVWKEVHANTDYKIRIWTDSGAYLSTFLGKKIKIGTEKYENDSGAVPCVGAREVMVTVLLQDKIFDTLAAEMSSKHSFDEAAKMAMQKYDLASDELIESALTTYKSSWYLVKDLGIEVREISELWGIDDEMKSYYYRELGLRQIPAAASDIVRVLILKNFGEVYADIDLLPSMSKEKIDGMESKSGYQLFYPEFRDQLESEKWKVREEVQRFITKKLMDRRVKHHNNDDNFIDLKLSQEATYVNWELLDKLMDTEPGSIVNWSNPLRDVRVPPGSEAAMAKYWEGGFNNNFMAASYRKESGNPCMTRVETEILEEYVRIERWFVRLPHGVWPGWPLRESDLTTAKAYRLDGIVRDCMATIKITGPSAVMKALAKYDAFSNTGELSERKTNDHLLGSEYFNKLTDEEESTWISQDDKDWLNEESQRFNLILQIGNDKAVKFASKAIYANSLWKGRGVHLFWDGEAKTFIDTPEHFAEKRAVEIKLEKKINVAVVGHGDGIGGIIGIMPEELAKGLNDAITLKMQRTTEFTPSLAKVSFVACQRYFLVVDEPLPDGFVKSFLENVDEALDPKQTVVTLRNSDVQTNELGKKLYLKPRRLMPDVRTSLCCMKDLWTRGEIYEGRCMINTRVFWHGTAKTWWVSPKPVYHKDFIELDKVLDRSGPLNSNAVMEDSV